MVFDVGSLDRLVERFLGKAILGLSVDRDFQVYDQKTSRREQYQPLGARGPRRFNGFVGRRRIGFQRC